MTIYKDESGFYQQPCANIGVLLVNLGTPDDASVKSVRRYLAEFLWDPRVVEKPRLLWWLILNLVILPLRSRRAAHAYGKVWDDKKGSPLLYLSQSLSDKLEQALKGKGYAVTLAMRYGNPSIASGLRALRDANIRKILIVPLYPQYSATTTAAVWDAVNQELGRWRQLPQLRMIMDYHDQPGYIQEISQHIQEHWQRHSRAEKLLFSFHGLPQRLIELGDPYERQCRKTAQEIAKTLALSEDQWKLTFQSRFGPETWLQPYTDKTLEAWGRKGIESVDIVCPGFSVDCLETLEEIKLENRQIFFDAGGRDFNYIAALNDSERHTRLLCNLIEQHTQNWSG